MPGSQQPREQLNDLVTIQVSGYIPVACKFQNENDGIIPDGLEVGS